MANEIEKEFDNEPVANLLRNLKRVEAPKDFDFKVKARIAKGVAPTRTGLPLWVKAAAPVVLLVALGGYLGMSSLQTPKTSDVRVAAIAPQPKVDAPAAATVPFPMTQPVIPSAPSVSRTDNSTVATVKKPVVRSRPTGGSIVSAARIPKEIILSEVPVSEALSRSGAGATFDGSRLKVGSTIPNGAAGRSGLKAGDVIESINGKAVDAASTVRGRLEGKTVRVRRDGKTVDILIKN